MIDKKIKGKINQKKKLNLVAMRRMNQRIVEHLVQKKQEFIIYKRASIDLN